MEPGHLSRRNLFLSLPSASVAQRLIEADVARSAPVIEAGAWLDAFDGRTDTQKLRDALEKRCPVLRLPARRIHVTEPLEPKAPLSLVGPGRYACEIFCDLDAVALTTSRSERQVSITGGIGIRGNPLYENCGAFDLFDNAGAPIDDIVAFDMPGELLRLRQGVGCHLSNILTSAVGRGRGRSAIFIDPGAESSVGISLDTVTVYGADCGIRAGTTRLLTLRNLIVQDSQCGGSFENCDGSYEFHSENNLVDLRLIDCGRFIRAFLSTPNGDGREGPMIDRRWTRSSDSAMQLSATPDTCFGGMIRPVAQSAGPVAQWIDVLFSERLPSVGVNPIPGGYDHAILRFTRPGVYRLNYSIAFLNRGAEAERVGARVLYSGGDAFEEVRGSLRTAWISAGASAQIVGESSLAVRAPHDEVKLQFSVSGAAVSADFDMADLAEPVWRDVAQLSVMFLGAE